MSRLEGSLQLRDLGGRRLSRLASVRLGGFQLRLLGCKAVLGLLERGLEVRDGLLETLSIALGRLDGLASLLFRGSNL